MAKQNTDRTTIDLFSAEKRVGRPKTNPLDRKEQLKINKRNQVRRDRNAGIKRIELKVGTELFDALNGLAAYHGMSRSDLIESVLLEHLNQASSESHQLETG
ncbi:LexA regulated protein [Alginatibacterium sediminis]|uniref:LexA regulated protein n=1 Tax=Alginatibacterium sediminis TaxID=2164068 RepID=A0A420EAX5_9ALTE|nr:LexA regulated protein [Alginatibacterium sediminis]RKF17847.1 LexA regulated protein [Alginatibacterium sediminis]